MQMARRLRATTRKVGDLALPRCDWPRSTYLARALQRADAMTHRMVCKLKSLVRNGRNVGCSARWFGRVLKTLEDQGLVLVKGKTMVVTNTLK